MDKVLVIVVVFNGMKWLEECLTSVYNSSVQADLFIIDNGSSDGSIEYIRKHFPTAIFEVSQENLGFGKANNLGLKYAVDKGYDFVYLLNQDAWVEEDTFEKLIRISKSHPDFGILSPLQTNREKTRLDSNFSDYCGVEILSDYLCKQPLKEIYSVKFVMAAHWMIPVATIRLVGAFSPSFYHYGEDNNFIDRALYYGKNIGIVPSTIGVHDREYRKDSREKRKYLFMVSNLIMLSDPSLKSRRFLHLIVRYVRMAIKHRELFSFRHLFKTLSLYKTLSSNRRKSMKKGAFLD